MAALTIRRVVKPLRCYACNPNFPRVRGVFNLGSDLHVESLECTSLEIRAFAGQNYQHFPICRHSSDAGSLRSQVVLKGLVNASRY